MALDSQLPAPGGEGPLHELFKAAGLWTWDANLVDDTTVYEPGFWEAYGYTEQPTETFDMVQTMHRADRAAVTKAYRAHLEDETDIYESEWRLRTADGEWRWTRSRGKITRRAEDGTPLQMAGVYMDITEGREAEHERQRPGGPAHGHLPPSPFRREWRRVYASPQGGCVR